MAVFAVALWLLLAVSSQQALGLQVAPGSPCSEICLDGKDAKSSDIDGDDVVCNDFEFQSEKTGKRFQGCMTCLQESDYAKGSETDLDWFLFNLRYSFDYCTFGDMHAKDVDANPCATSEGCGKLAEALRSDMVNSTDRAQYGYCEVDGQSISGEGLDKCLLCVSAESTRSYLSNFLVALAIGCEQRPGPGELLGLNETVFTKNTVQAVNPSDLDPQDDSGLLLSTAVIVGISVGGFVVVLLALGCGYMQYRKRKNRHRVSGWSFRCQARSGSLPTREAQLEEEAKRARFNEAIGEKTWTSPYESRITGLFPPPPQSTMADDKESGKHGITSIVTSAPPRPALQTSGRSFQGSPVQDEHMTPASATSVRSTRPLLHGDSPASYTARSPSSHYGQAVGMSRSGASPPEVQPSASAWGDEQRMAPSRSRPLTRSTMSTRQVEARNFGTSFPPPPRQ